MSTGTQESPIRATNASVGERLGITHAHVSRLRYGQRFPSLDLMNTIAEETGWDITAQYASRRRGTYPEDFRQRFDLTDDRESEDGTPAASGQS